MKIRQALISLSDKRGAGSFARGLSALGVTLLSTGGTAKLLREEGLKVVEIADYTGFPEILDGRVKTLHPKVHAGILARRDQPAHMATLQERAIPTIDLVCVNLYPFFETVSDPGATLEKAIENIDIGGPAMIRSSAKNYADVVVVTDPGDYSAILDEMRLNDARLSLKTRFALAKKAFVHTARYDGAIANWLTALGDDLPEDPAIPPTPAIFPQALQLAFNRGETLRYGENPHQKAAFYRDAISKPGTISAFRQLQGKELSYNNIADADAALECVKSFESPACVIVKHANPCGVAVAGDPAAAYRKAFLTDSTSAFGGILAFNRAIDVDVIDAVGAHFVEVLIAPAFTPAARERLTPKQNLRVLEIPFAEETRSHEMKSVGGGLLVQTPDSLDVGPENLKVVTQIAPTAQQIEDMLFAWRVVQFVKSNAIVFCAQGMTLGIGAGQMSRVDSARIACRKARDAGLSLAASCVASDAFFPFRDALDILAEAGARAVIQPGGSIRDGEVVSAADEHGIAMVFTGVRHFRH
ncbi:MAG: bifunctional phosphoribosylaminoimidazolecarboxamide formyltransferase/IMP cyclohydrolase [Candidatus Accumulibacter sp.]|jgi:phosphoribosylaminoimidazolecarboxamide formyltransferase/IMP cyclohydrolase|nr:bifunctional phosphoribosylaminoimidazolecarboxamide formyltransferase/IMP cyclohydrolase [Accumulibacter sp.]